MGRLAGVTAEETRERSLQGAAKVFAHKGYDGASIAEIAAEAGLSSGALYAHFGSKAELFVATLHAHGSGEVEHLLAVGTSADLTRMLRDRGVALDRREPGEGSLLVEAIVAAKRHPHVAELLVAAFTESESRITQLVEAGKRTGAVGRNVRAAAVSRFVLMLSLGSLLVAAMELPPVEEDDWSALIDDLIGRFNPGRST